MKYFSIFLLLFFLLFPFISFGSTLMDYYTPSPDYWTGICGANRIIAQTFTATTSYNAQLLSLPLYRVGNPGTFTFGIYPTDVNGYPTSSALASGSYNGDTLTEDTNGAYYDLAFDATTSLSQGTVYAIEVKDAAGTQWSNCIKWADKNTTGSYAGGSYFDSANDGASWSKDASSDQLFKVWDDYTAPTPPPVSGQLTFPWVLITILAAFILCFIIDKGGSRIIEVINGMYRYKF